MRREFEVAITRNILGKVRYTMDDDTREYILNEFHNAVRYTLEHWNEFSEEDYNKVMEELQKEVDKHE